jgi:hypothetical protein
MGGARLLDLSKLPTKSDCASSATISTTTIILTNVGDQERAIRLILPPGAFPDASAGATGKLLLMRAGKPVTEIGLTLQREDYAPFAKAFLWFWGVATPAVVAAIIGMFVYRYQKSVDAKASEDIALDRFRKDMAEDVKKFFEGLYQTTVTLEKDSDYQSTMERELAAQRILFALPGKARERVIAALRKYDRAAVSDELAKAFPDYEQTILKSQRGKDNPNERENP